MAGFAEHSAGESVSESLRKSNVAAAIAEIQERSERATIASIVERKEALTQVLRAPEGGPYPIKDVIAASDQLNKIDRVYSDQHTGAVNIQINVVYRDERLAEAETIDGAMAAGDEEPA